MKKEMIIEAWVRYRPESIAPSQGEEKKETKASDPLGGNELKKKVKVQHKDKELEQIFGP